MPEKQFLFKMRTSDARLIVAALERSFHGETPEIKKRIARLTSRLRPKIEKAERGEYVQ